MAVVIYPFSTRTENVWTRKTEPNACCGITYQRFACYILLMKKIKFPKQETTVIFIGIEIRV